MDLYLEQFIDDMVSNLEYRNGIFKTTWDYTLVGLFFIVALPIVGFLALKERFL
jgi:hypothetical protein